MIVLAVPHLSMQMQSMDTASRHTCSDREVLWPTETKSPELHPLDDNSESLP